MPTIRVRQIPFELGREWQPGHEMTPGEARALTQLFAENVRNNVDGWVKKALGDREALEFTEHAELQLRISAYAQAYEFRDRPPEAAPLHPLDRHARAIAEERLRGQEGLAVGEAVPAAALEALARDPSIRLEAQLRWDAERTAAARAIEALGGLD